MIEKMNFKAFQVSNKKNLLCGLIGDSRLFGAYLIDGNCDATVLVDALTFFVNDVLPKSEAGAFDVTDRSFTIRYVKSNGNIGNKKFYINDGEKFANIFSNVIESLNLIFTPTKEY